MLPVIVPLLVVALASAAPAEEPDPRAERLKAKSVEELLACAAEVPGPGEAFSEATYCGATPWLIAEELGSRGIESTLIAMFPLATDAGRSAIVDALTTSSAPEVEAFMRSIAAPTPGYECEANRYLALRVLKTKSDSELLAFAAEVPSIAYGDDAYCGTGDRWDIARELHSRNIDAALVAMFGSVGEAARDAIVDALYFSADPAVVPLMEAVAFGATADHRDAGAVETAKKYLAQRCDSRVLREWSKEPFEMYPGPTGCLEWERLMLSLGVCDYEPAIPYLVWMLDATCLNLVASAEDGLRRFYPNEERFESWGEMKAYYQKRAAVSPKHFGGGPYGAPLQPVP